MQLMAKVASKMPMWSTTFVGITTTNQRIERTVISTTSGGTRLVLLFAMWSAFCCSLPLVLALPLLTISIESGQEDVESTSEIVSARMAFFLGSLRQHRFHNGYSSTCLITMLTQERLFVCLFGPAQFLLRNSCDTGWTLQVSQRRKGPPLCNPGNGGYCLYAPYWVLQQRSY